MEFSTNYVSVCEYVFGEHSLDEIVPKIHDSISNEDDNWSDYCSDNWYEFGESEYGLDDVSIELFLVLIMEIQSQLIFSLEIKRRTHFI